MATPSAPGAQLVTTLTGQELVEIITAGSQKAVVSVGTLIQAVGTSTIVTYVANPATASFTIPANNVDGGGVAETALALTGTLAGAANAQMPTVAALVAVQPAFAPGASFKSRVINLSSGAFTWTITTNTGWTLNGAMTIPQNTWRDFYITFTSATAAVLQTVGTGIAP